MMDEKFPVESESDDKSLASLFAKFDRRMEALWELEPDSEIPPSFSLLANMPADQHTNALNSKASPNYSFILSGTNITSSIWSQCPINSCLTPGLCNVDNTDGKEATPDSYNGSRVVGSELKKLAIKTGLVTPQLENFRIIWEESTTLFPPQFIGVEKVVSAEAESSASTVVKEEETQEQQQPNVEGEGIMLSPLVCYHTVTKESLEALNHSREKSGFTEVTPRLGSKCSSCSDVNQLESKPTVPPTSTCPSTQPSKANSEEDEEVEEDLLTSARTHFLPIRRLSVDSSSGLSESNGGGVHYEDGTTFSIQSALEKVTFYRSESGNLILKEEPEEGEDGNCKTPKKYMIYKGAIGLKGRGFLADQDNSGFLPKFLVRQNEKSCQTDESDESCSVGVANCCYASIASIEIGEEEVDVSKGEECEFFFPGDAYLADALDGMDQGEEEQPKVVSVVEWSLGEEVPPARRPLSESGSEGKEEMSALSQDTSWPTVPSLLCQCSSSSISASNAAQVWEQKACSGQCWNKIWRSSPIARDCSLQEMDLMAPISQLAAATGELEMQSKLLRQELSEESEQLFADLHMVRQMYLGMDWMGPDDEQDDLDEEIENKSLPCDEILPVRKRNSSGCKKVSENLLNQALLDDNIVASHEKVKAKKIPYSSCLDYDLMEEIFGPLDPEMDNLLTTNISPMAPKGIFFSFELEAEWRKNERNASMKACPNDHKRRRHSSGRGPRRDLLTHSNQLQLQRRRPCSFFVSDGSCHRSHCRFSHDLSSVPCRFWSDGSCLRGIACPFLHSSASSPGSPSLSPPPHRPRKQHYIPIFPTAFEPASDDPSMRPITL
ncbi:uncharacterized protein LOC124155424 isoform X2 [Ischnura elegans]|uniref:uncharacterized protein LOC124155424 isoform X2 n=1 Tax=Ischnura elegans TaxID=197161 RepID=UPI001ED8A18A|nr:uncharacterized protein LOC124155424 isoform X2 [Ischnura elegans]